tara:strand:+ start:746 stop:1009 length:264 start_codon:yes stop_codon:yes gene_type:complete
MRSPASLILLALPAALAAPAPAAGNLGTATTQNGLAGGCKPMMVVFARGTTEQGNVGSLSGPPWFAAMGKAVGAQNLAVQGVDYPAE